MTICRYTKIVPSTQAISRRDVLTWQTYRNLSSPKAGEGEKEHQVLWAIYESLNLCKTQVNEKKIPLMESQAANVIVPSSYSALIKGKQNKINKETNKKNPLKTNKKNHKQTTRNWRCHWISLRPLNNFVILSLTGGKAIMYTVRAKPILRKEAFSENSFSHG